MKVASARAGAEAIVGAVPSLPDARSVRSPHRAPSCAVRLAAPRHWPGRTPTRRMQLEGLDGRTVDAITAGFVSGAHRDRYIPSQQTRMATFYRHCDLDPHAGKSTGIRKFYLGAADDNPAA